MLTLQNLLDAFAEGGAEAVEALFAANPAIDAGALRGEAADAFQALYAAAERSTEDVAQMSVLADVIDVCRAEEGRRTEAAAAAAAQADELAARALGAPADAPAADAPAADAPPADAPLTGEVVEAAPAARRPRVDLAAIARRAPQAEPPVVPIADEQVAASHATIEVAADVPGMAAGTEITFAGAADALLSRSKSFPTEYQEGRRIGHQFALVRKPEPAFTLNDASDHMDVIDRIADETRLEGGSLVAAGGWCAPSETWYDLCPGLESGAGMLDLPTGRAPRGGVRWTKGPQFCDFYAGTGFFTMTEAQDIAGTFEKPCYEIPCPDFVEDRLDAYGLCLTAGILQNKGYPEYVSRFIQGSLVAHAHRMNALKIKALVAQSTVVSSTRDSAAVGATNSILESIELHVVSYRYRFRMDPSRSLEAVLPLWVRGPIRADLGRRAGVDHTSISDAEIDGWFRDRGVNPQFVYDWQDAMCGSTDVDSGTTMGAAPATVTNWPLTVKVLLYPAGTFVALEQDVITLESVYDSVLFKKNRYTALFTEEAWTIINRCYESLLLQVDFVANGAQACCEDATPA